MAINDLPPGFRFHPHDEELVGYYLHRKVNGWSIAGNHILEHDLYSCEPFELGGIFGADARTCEWYVFSPRNRKYSQGSRTNRATNAGYWKATGKDRMVRVKGKQMGGKKTLVFYEGRAPKGRRTNWVMHEYYMEQAEGKKEIEDSYVLCRVFKKAATNAKERKLATADFEEDEDMYTPEETEEAVVFDQPTLRPAKYEALSEVTGGYQQQLSPAFSDEYASDGLMNTDAHVRRTDSDYSDADFEVSPTPEQSIFEDLNLPADSLPDWTAAGFAEIPEHLVDAAAVDALDIFEDVFPLANVQAPSAPASAPIEGDLEGSLHDLLQQHDGADAALDEQLGGDFGEGFSGGARQHPPPLELSLDAFMPMAISGGEDVAAVLPPHSLDGWDGIFAAFTAQYAPDPGASPPGESGASPPGGLNNNRAVPPGADRESPPGNGPHEDWGSVEDLVDENGVHGDGATFRRRQQQQQQPCRIAGMQRRQDSERSSVEETTGQSERGVMLLMRSRQRAAGERQEVGSGLPAARAADVGAGEGHGRQRSLVDRLRQSLGYADDDGGLRSRTPAAAASAAAANFEDESGGRFSGDFANRSGAAAAGMSHRSQQEVPDNSFVEIPSSHRRSLSSNRRGASVSTSISADVAATVAASSCSSHDKMRTTTQPVRKSIVNKYSVQHTSMYPRSYSEPEGSCARARVFVRRQVEAKKQKSSALVDLVSRILSDVPVLEAHAADLPRSSESELTIENCLVEPTKLNSSEDLEDTADSMTLSSSKAHLRTRNSGPKIVSEQLRLQEYSLTNRCGGHMCAKKWDKKMRNSGFCNLVGVAVGALCCVSWGLAAFCLF